MLPGTTSFGYKANHQLYLRVLCVLLPTWDLGSVSSFGLTWVLWPCYLPIPHFGKKILFLYLRESK